MRTSDRLAVVAAALSALIGVLSIGIYLSDLNDRPAQQPTPSPTPSPTRPPVESPTPPVTRTPTPPVPVQRIEIVVIPGTPPVAAADGGSSADWAGLLTAFGAFLAGLGSLGAIAVALRKAPGQPSPPPAAPPQDVKPPEAG